MNGSDPEIVVEPPRPTLKTIALETGLAIATVSRALKDAPDIGEETKRRVREVAKRVGYQPNRAGVRLRTGKTNVIALVLSTEADVMNHTSQLIYSVAAALRGTPYHMVVMPFFPDQDPMEPVRYIVETGSADGIIINQTKPNDARVAYMASHGFPFAAHGRTDMGIEHTYFDFDNENFSRLGAEVLLGKGRRKLAILAPPPEHSYGRHMIEGFAQAASKEGLSIEVLEDVTSDNLAAHIDNVMRVRMAREDRPDGILCGSTTAAMAAIAAAEAVGLKLGKDFDTVAKEAFGLLHRFRPEVIVVRENVSEAGDFLARALVSEIERRAEGVSQFVAQPVIWERE
ncbi:LacI family transcriptional regulator [Neogemmobacter tilapiae]|uniref:LacI family transcriptional regulator n=1 Tax=Neogemmobacter tilapiae TaxID=875041 RepID=A0A918TTE4_9RHOB|nr:LacI family transcriptional regulator [Gemmobacter tilapiae]GHC61097.1 LacI family transcriptional regulator [Gemmobacter tilapiae]